MNNEPAFPNIQEGMNIQGGPGMSIRDYFAAKAMQGILYYDRKMDTQDGKTVADAIAENAYFMADAMLKEREKKS